MIFKRLASAVIWLIFTCCFSLTLKAQKYYFQHYDIGDGLIQSQVTAICQDNNKQIWLSTLGGINCFDSKQFSPFTIANGLPANACFALTRDKQGNIWSGSLYGVTEFERSGLKRYTFRESKMHEAVRMLMCDSQGTVWALRGRFLYKFAKGKFHIQTIASGDEWVTTTQLNNKGEIFAAVAKKGIYKFENNQWKLYCNQAERPEIELINDFVFDNINPDLLHFITDSGLYTFSKGLISEAPPALFEHLHPNFTCLLLDSENGLWIGTDNGAYLLKNGKLTRFNDKNGFTNVRVFCMLKDADNQIWFGSDGDGLFKYQNNTFLLFDKTQGLVNEVIMTLAKDKNDDVYMGSYGGSLLYYKNHQMTDMQLPRSKMQSLRVNYLYIDHSNDLWIGTDDSGLWLKKENRYFKIYPKIGDRGYSMVFTTISEDSDNNLWVTTPGGCFYLKDKTLIKVKDFNKYCSSLIGIGKDSLLVGTYDGVRLIRNKAIDENFPNIFPGQQITALLYRKPFIIAATNERGVFIYNMITKSVQRIFTANGLNSDMVYSILLVGNQLWVGTGRGINKYNLNIVGNELKFNIVPLVGLAFECNENAILKVKNEIWIGTTHGINVYPLFNSSTSNSATKVVIENVQTYTDNSKKVVYRYFDGYKIPDSLSIPSARSHIAIKFQAINYNAGKITYQYMLDGLDNTYSTPSQSSFVDYPELPPGKYVFRVRAVTEDNLLNGIATYKFTVAPEFYQTSIFRFIVIILLLSIIVSIPIYKNYLNRKRLNFIHQLRLREQENVRRQTGEDFHDDLGNKLTRINILSELLDKKMSPDLKEEKKLTEQIRSSAIEMYNGTKSILWALNPQNDHLNEVLNEVEKFGYSLFENIGIVFTASSYVERASDIKLPLGYSHNIVLIFKELMNNILKHAVASSVTFSYQILSYNQVCLVISDNGKGYNTNESFEGSGLKNIQNRTQKLKGELLIDSRPGEGTTTKLIVNIT